VSPQLLSGMISALWNKPSNVASLLVEPLLPAPISQPGFTAGLGYDTLLQTIEDKVPILPVFFQQVCTRALAAKGSPLQARLAEDYLRSVAGQTFLELGQPDPRLNSAGKMDFRIQRMLSSFKKESPPPNHVKAVPVSILRHIILISAVSIDAEI